MKKLQLLLAFFIVTFSVFAGDNNLIGLNKKHKKDKGMISNGIYLHVGIGFPSFTGTDYTLERQSQGVQGSIEFGNQWMFVKQEKFGFGLNVSWITLGGSSYKIKDTDIKGTDLQFNLLRFGPMASIGLGDDMALDAFFNVSPTMKVNFLTLDDEVNTAIMYGATFVPGVKFRYKKLAVGFESAFGSLRVEDTDSDNTIDDQKIKIAYFNPRVLVGFKF